MGKSGLVQIGTRLLNPTGEAPVPEGRSPDPSPRTGLVRWREHHSFSLITFIFSLPLSRSTPSSLLPSPSCSFFSSSSSLHTYSSSKPQNILDPDLTAEGHGKQTPMLLKLWRDLSKVQPPPHLAHSGESPHGEPPCIHLSSQRTLATGLPPPPGTFLNPD